MNYLEIVDSILVIRIPLAWIQLFVLFLGVKWAIQVWWKAKNASVKLQHWLYQKRLEDAEADRLENQKSTHPILKRIIKAVKEGKYK